MDESAERLATVIPGGAENDTELHVFETTTGRETGDVILRAVGQEIGYPYRAYPEILAVARYPDRATTCRTLLAAKAGLPAPQSVSQGFGAQPAALAILVSGVAHGGEQSTGLTYR